MIRKRLLLTHNKIKPYIHIADTTADNIVITFGNHFTATQWPGHEKKIQYYIIYFGIPTLLQILHRKVKRKSYIYFHFSC